MSISAEMNELEQQDYFEQMEKKTSFHLAFFYCCIKFDLPFATGCVPNPGTPEAWLAYVDELRRKKLDVDKNKRELGFLDGLTDITRIFGPGLSSGDFSKTVAVEKNATQIKGGTAKQRKDWGDGYTAEDYKEFDRIFPTLASDLGGEDALSSKQEFILRNVTRWQKEVDDLVKHKKYASAKQVSALIQENLASDNLRKKDIRPADIVRVDEITDRLEKSGLLKNGKQCHPTELFYRIFGYLPECKFCQIKDTDKCKYQDNLVKNRYPYTLDAADQIILINENRMRKNDGLPELSRLPDEMRLRDDLGEFAKEQNDIEKESYDKLGLVKMGPLKDKG